MIGGLTPCSFIDFPGCLSAVVFLRGCNLRCPYCHNAGLLDGDGPVIMKKDDLLAFLSSRRGRLDGVVFSGGEPTLRPELRSLIEAARELGFKVKLDTNGTRPEVISELLDDGLLDYVALDLKDEPEAYPEWLGPWDAPETIYLSIDILKRSGIDHELRTTVVLPRHDPSRLARMAEAAVGARRWILQSCRTDARQPSLALASSRDAALEALASRLRERYGVNCRCRSGESAASGRPSPPAKRGELLELRPARVRVGCPPE